MAQSISDVFARAERGGEPRRRKARFLGPQRDSGTEEGMEDDSPELLAPTLAPEESVSRRAAFRPNEDLALRRDIIDAFTTAIQQDTTRQLGDYVEGELAVALSAETLGNYELAFQHLRELKRSGHQLSWNDGAIWHRVLRALDSKELIGPSLKESLEIEEAPRWFRLYASLERAALGWANGDDPQRVKRRVERALKFVQAPSDLDTFASLWAMQLFADSALESSSPEEAMTALEGMLAQPGLGSEIRLALEARRAVWLHVYGNQEQALICLDDLAARGALPGDLDDLLLHLYFEEGQRDRAFQLLRSQARETSRLQIHAIPLIMLHQRDEGALQGRNILRAATEEHDDWTLLRLREQLLESLGDCGSELIDVLNRRLEGPLPTTERIQLLTRLGRLYEEEASLEEAAAEVYREALSYDPQHVPALRALGRLYTRRENWRGLAELYEREIASQACRQGSWRRHFQVAELYEHRLQRDEKALENYLVVLDVNPNYLPALKSSARILGRLERWARLADLFLRMVDSAPSRRQKLYLLDKVAEVAEVRLQNFDVAIGAWQEILELDPENPRVFTALGRLFSRTGRWQELIALNEAETDLIEDSEEVAAVLLRNAEIAEQNLEDIELAERFYRRALNVIPDYLPALEALGRIYLRGGRWGEIVSMTGRELRNVEEPHLAVRQLGALAEIFETRLDRRADAIAIYEELLHYEPANAHVYASLTRLYRNEGRFDALERLLLERATALENSTEVASIYGELAVLAEWQSCDSKKAFSRYFQALKAEPTNLHWLSGVARTWQESGNKAAEVADALEDLLMHACAETLRDRYFLTIARLRERAEGDPEASRAYRAHGDGSSLENQTVLRIAMAAAGERESLTEARRGIPHFPMQESLVADRRGELSALKSIVRKEKDLLPPSARNWLSGQLPVEAAVEFKETSPLRRDLFQILEGRELFHNQADEAESGQTRRLRALQARQQGDHQAYIEWTEREIAFASQEVAAARYLELARYVFREDCPGLERYLSAACTSVFPELREDEEVGTGQIQISFTYPLISSQHLEELFAALEEIEDWHWLRQTLEVRVSRPGLDNEERLHLFRKLANVLEKRLQDYEGARDALVHCWQISEEPYYLREIVRLASVHQRRPDALRFQRRHYQALSERESSSTQEKIQAGLWLADLLLKDGPEEEVFQGIECLESLARIYGDCDEMNTALRMLARAYGSIQEYGKAVSLFESILHFQVRGDEIEDWRLLVQYLRGPLDCPDRAYLCQWNLVRAFPDSQVDLDVLVDLAGEAGELADCMEQLSQLASATTSAGKVTLLARAAEAADEELGYAEEAYRLFDRVMELTPLDHPQRRYYERRRAICLARMAGRESLALEAFRNLLDSEPFEPANFRGMETLFERCGALDRLRITRQSLRMLGCETKEEEGKTKVHPTRSLTEGALEQGLLPDSLKGGVLEVLRATMPLAEKIWSEELPQRKAFDGQKLRDPGSPGFYNDLQSALLAFGLSRFKLFVGESGPEVPMVFPEGTPVVWIHEKLLEKVSPAESRFLAGYCAAMIFSEIASLTALDGRKVWHLMEGALYRQTGRGFSERVDIESQNMAEIIGGPFDGSARKRVHRALEGLEGRLAECHCEAWGREVEIFAARAGLLLAGDLAAATRGLLLIGGWSLTLDESATQRRIRNEDTVADLVQLAHSEEYLELRYRLGLAGRPSRVKI